MKTESDILLEILGDKIVSLNATFLGQTAADPYINISAFPLVYEAMQLYSDQQNKEKDLDLIAANQYVSELRKENKELREEKERLIAGIRKGQHLAENLKWSDDPNAEGFTANEKEIQRLTKEVGELKRGMQKLPFDTVADYELCKKAYQSSSEHAEGFAIKLAKADAENTRLLELLGTANSLLEWIWDNVDIPSASKCVEMSKTRNEINNALNHKP